ncbi:HGxxPAAW family protein [Streptomyces sp. NPDC056049]|uniref:HGxxPAAW family protein n=1 Tax=Streptomyces sp. NPDC056049 TaxID=3345693 RepID=UPI0035DC5E13
MSAHGDVDLGHTLAGWTGTALATLGCAVLGLALCLGSAAAGGLGTALLAAAALVTWLLHLAGWGKPSGPRPPDQWDWRVRDTTAGTRHPDCLGCRLAGRRAATAHTPGPDTTEPAPAPPQAQAQARAATVRA